MKLKNLVVIILFFCICGITAVYSNFVKINDIKIAGVLSDNIFIDSQTLNKTIIAIKSPLDISENKFKGLCESKTDFLYNTQDLYFFELELDDKNCANGNFYLLNYNGDLITNTNFELNIITNTDTYLKYIDYSDSELNKFKSIYFGNLEEYYTYKNLTTYNTKLSFVKNNRLYKESEYYYNIVSDIIQKRLSKYYIPVEGFTLTTKLSKLPNTGRPYRASYTDGIHEGWDIDAPYGTPVRSIDNGYIIKIVNGFEFEDLDNIVSTGAISDEQKSINLDILRGNQVWIKTMKGDVIFYAHLSYIDENLKVGDYVSAKQFLGNIGRSGVPDREYSDFHLHFELRQNPRIYENAGEYTLMDYMEWDWYMKGKSSNYILDNQYNIFQY